MHHQTPRGGRSRPWITTSIICLLGLLFTNVAAAQDMMDSTDVAVYESMNLGLILVGSNGMTLYTWDRDEPGSPTVTTSAPAVWPPLIVTATPMGPMGLSGLGTATRSDGALQATFDGKPLYFFANDTAPGDTNGQAVANLWWVVPVSMDMMMEDVMTEDMMTEDPAPE